MQSFAGANRGAGNEAGPLRPDHQCDFHIRETAAAQPGSVQYGAGRGRQLGKNAGQRTGGIWITVNNVLPGATATGRLPSIINHKAEKTGLSVEQVAEEMKSEIPLQRFAEPVEVANAIVFLASPQASYINGINLPVDGGRTKSL